MTWCAHCHVHCASRALFVLFCVFCSRILSGTMRSPFVLRPRSARPGPDHNGPPPSPVPQKQKTEGETNNQANKVLLFFFCPKHTNKSLTTLNNPNNPARRHKQQYPPTLPASAPCRRSDKVRPRQRTLEHSPQRLKKLYSIFCKKKRAKISWRNR